MGWFNGRSLFCVICASWSVGSSSACEPTTVSVRMQLTKPRAMVIASATTDFHFSASFSWPCGSRGVKDNTRAATGDTHIDLGVDYAHFVVLLLEKRVLLTLLLELGRQRLDLTEST